MSKSAPGFATHPNHRIDIEEVTQTVRVSFANHTIATSTRALLVRESRYDPVIYLPITDCKHEWYIPSNTETYCPFKGTASYWSLQIGEELAVDAVWEYRDPYKEMAAIKNAVAFYQSKFDIDIKLD